MRVTEGLRFGAVARQISSLRSEHYKTVNQATTGLRITSPSEDPTRAGESTRLRSAVNALEANQRSISFVQGDLAASEAALADAMLVIQRAQEIAMTGSNGSNGAEQHQALALEAQQLTEQLTSLANSKGSRGYLFSGTAVKTAAFDSEGKFAGNDLEHRIEIGPGQEAVVNVSGARAFTVEGGIDAFEVLNGLANALAEGDFDTVRQSLENLTAVHEQLSRERSRAGLALNRLDMATDINEDTLLKLNEHQSDIIAAVPEEIYSRLSQLEQAIETSVAVGRKLLDIQSIDRF